MIFSACPPVYTLPGTWSDPEKIAKCNDTLIPHFTFNPDYTFGISIAVITIMLAGYGSMHSDHSQTSEPKNMTITLLWYGLLYFSAILSLTALSLAE